jgi:phosphate transport system permease protein
VNLYTRRQIVNRVGLTLSVLATLFGLFWLFWLLGTLFGHGLQWVSPRLFREVTPAPGANGGLANAIVGSVILTALGIALGAPAGILAGTYLAEFGRTSRLGVVVRFVNDILLSAPSIIIGVFVYALIVLRAGHFSGWAGAVALALIVLPVVVRTTENMMRLVPDGLREAAAALGAPSWKITIVIVYRSALPGILTGVLLGMARISGETAPLLFTALNNQFWSTDLSRPFPNLPAVIFQFAMSPYDDWQHLAWAGALLITVTILVINIVARVLLRRTTRP